MSEFDDSQERWTDPAEQARDGDLDRTLRPKTLDDFVGQKPR